MAVTIKCNAELLGIQCARRHPHPVPATPDYHWAEPSEAHLQWTDDVPGAKPHEEPEPESPRYVVVCEFGRFRVRDRSHPTKLEVADFALPHPDSKGAAEAEARRLNGEPCCDAAAAKRDKEDRHRRHYLNCGCLGDSAVCCDPKCCPQSEEVARLRSERDDLRERLAAIVSSDPDSEALHRPVDRRSLWCVSCPHCWPCPTACAAGIGEVSS